MTAPTCAMSCRPTPRPSALPDDGEVLLARRGSRVTPQLLSADSMRLLEQFRTPSTLTEAILALLLGDGERPDGDPRGGLRRPRRAHPRRPARRRRAPTAQPLSRTASGSARSSAPRRITSRLRTLRDSEVWRGELCDGTAVVVKIVDEPASVPTSSPRGGRALPPLAAGRHGRPALVWHEATPTGGTLVLTEVTGDPVDLAVADRDDKAAGRWPWRCSTRTQRCTSGVLHGDVHAGNVLLRPDGTVTIIDFGLAVVTATGRAAASPAARAGGGEGLDPACADALLHGHELPPLDGASEQYAVATLLHRILTSSAYLDLACEREEALRRITTDEPRRFAATGTAPWPSGERVMRRALATSPADRFPSTAALRDAFVAATRNRNSAVSSAESDSVLRERQRRLARSMSTGRSGRARTSTRPRTSPGSCSGSPTSRVTSGS